MKVAPMPRHHAPELLEHRIAPATLYGVDAMNNLYSFDSEAPAAFVSTIPVTGLLGTPGESIVGIDFRPATGELYVFSVDTAEDGHLYVVNEFTGAASLVGSITSPTLSPAADYGFDFNPLVDRIRVVNSVGENFRLNPNNGAVAGDDTNLTFSVPTIGPVDAVAYDRNFVGGNLTTLFGIDVGSDRLITVGGVNGTPSPNGGVISAVGVLGVNATEAHLDIETGSGTAFAALTVGGALGLYTIDLTTGAATLVGNINSGAPVLTGFAIAPPRATIVNAKTATYLDADGDLVTVKVSKGTLDESDFRFIAARNGGGTLRLIDFSDDGTEFNGANLTVTAAKKPGGDGEAHVGAIQAGGVDLGKVSIRGDLARIVAGDGDGEVIGLRSLQTNSMGRFGLATQAPGGALAATVTNGIGSVVIKGDLAASVQVFGVEGVLGSLRVGGSFVGEANGVAMGIFTTNGVGSITIAGDLRGGSLSGSGLIFSSGALDRISIVGDVIGGAGNSSASVVFFAIGEVKIGGDIIGGGGISSALVTSTTGRVEKISVGGGLYGGMGDNSGLIGSHGSASVTIKDGITGGFGGTSGYLNIIGDVGSVTLGNSLLGGSGDGGGSILVNGSMGSLKITGSVIGGLGEQSGQVFVDGATTRALITRNVVGGSEVISGNLQLRGGMDSLIVGGSVIGGSAENTGTLFFPGGAENVFVKRDLIGGSVTGAGTLISSGKIEADSIARLTIGGSIIAGSVGVGGTLQKSGGVYVNNDIGTFMVKGSLIGNESNPVRIVTRGQVTPDPGVDVALGSLKVGKDVIYTFILAGYDAADFGASTTDATGFEPVNGNAQIGAIAVGRHWLASQVSAGIRDVGGFGFGGSDDQVINNFLDGTLSRIGSIVIKGQFSGRGGGVETFGMVAQEIGSLKIGSIVYPFDATEGQVFALTSVTNDTFAREVIVI